MTGSKMHYAVRILACVAVLAVTSSAADAPGKDAATAPPKIDIKKVPAFPGAEGGGRYACGGRGGRVIEVTTLDDSGPGSFREALTAKGPRIVVFRVAGIIELKTRVTISEPFITIAGQTAPGDGICIKGETVVINTHDVVMRYMRFRRGAGERDDDAVKGYPTHNIMIDHCSFSWATNENVSLYRRRSKTADGYSPTKSITIQWSISSEGLDCASHSRGGIWGGRGASFHHNLLACNSSANPTIMYGEGLDFRNNVLFNWRHKAIDGGYGPGRINIVANYFKGGPAAHEMAWREICRPGKRWWGKEEDRWSRWYIADNYVDRDEKVTADNWLGVKAESNPPLDELRAKEPFAAAPITQQDAKAAYMMVLAGAGATLPVRDAVDKRVIEMVRTGNVTSPRKGIIKNPNEVGGWPQYNSADVPVDSDHDGMPDWWEKKHGLNHGDASDVSLDRDGDGYTNVEEYLNGTDPAEYLDYSKTENNINTIPQARK
jgi:pectate lyase